MDNSYKNMLLINIIKKIINENPIKHISWDYGSINKALGSVGIFTFQNTAKTLCGKRVGVNNIDNHNPTCQACLVEREKTKKLAKLVKEYTKG